MLCVDDDNIVYTLLDGMFPYVHKCMTLLKRMYGTTKLDSFV